MKTTRQNAQKMNSKKRQQLRFRETGKGFIARIPGPGVMPGMRLTTTYADQYERRYVQIDGSYELITAEHSFLAAD